ncbi:MAG: aminotransferase class V-fold PLP-dependent enzyme [Psychromonas sp.]
MSENNNQLTNLNRRDFLKKSTGLALAGAGTVMFAGSAHASKKDTDWKNHGHSDDKLWKEVRKEFVLDKKSVYMNVGTTGSMPEAVLKQYTKNNNIVATSPWDMQNKFGSWPYTTEMVESIASGFGANDSEIVISRNTTDGMCSIIHGMHFEEGDVILTTHHEHVGADSPFDVISKRNGVEIVHLEIPVYTGSEDISAQDFVDVFAKGIEEHKGRVRLIVFSHITYKTGTKLPAKEICELAVANKIPTLIDGAHTVGMLNLDFHDIDCDFYAGSGHKWQCGPGSTGLLYVRDDCSRLKEYWSDCDVPLWFVNSSLAHADYLGSQWQLQYKGNDNFPALQGFTDSCKMWDQIGRDKIEQRVLDLSALCKDLLEDNNAFPFGQLYAPNQRELSSGISSFNPFQNQQDLPTLNNFRDRLREEYGYIIRSTDFKVKIDDQDETHALRISTHLFHNEDDVFGLVEAMQDLYQKM